MLSALSPLSAFASTFAPALSSAFTASMFGLLVARISGVSPAELRTLTSAPAAIRRVTMSVSLRRAASPSAVQPPLEKSGHLQRELGDAPASSSIPTCAAELSLAARINGVTPSASARFGSAPSCNSVRSSASLSSSPHPLAWDMVHRAVLTAGFGFASRVASVRTASSFIPDAAERSASAIACSDACCLRRICRTSVRPLAAAGFTAADGSAWFASGTVTMATSPRFAASASAVMFRSSRPPASEIASAGNPALRRVVTATRSPSLAFCWMESAVNGTPSLESSARAASGPGRAKSSEIFPINP